MKKLFNLWPVAVILILAGFVAWPTFLPGYFSHHDDLQVMRIFEMRKCILDFQIPCRWVPDMGYGNGYPLFNYYAVLPYYIGAIASFFIGFLGSAKLLFALPLFTGAAGMFFLTRELFGKNAAILSAVLYTYAPYRALDLYVRGDVAESFAISLVPFVFYYALKLIKNGQKKYLMLMSISLSLFLTSHNIMTVLFIPVFLLITFYWLYCEKLQYIRLFIISFILGIGLASYFIFPAFFEKNLVQIDNLIRLDLNFRAHFVTFAQLFFDRTWGYGASVPGPNDTISFQVGWPHWWIALAAIFIFMVVSKFKFKVNDFLPLILFTIFIFTLFMTHNKSAFVWEKIEILKFTQFPWRFLSVSIFCASILGGYFISCFSKKYQLPTIMLIVAMTIFLNWGYFKPKEFYPDLKDAEKLSGFFWEDQQKAAILDYLPNGAVRPQEKAPDMPVIISGVAKIDNFENKSNKWQFNVEVENNAVVEVPVFYFPNWKINANNLPATSYPNKENSGRIDISFQKKGTYLVVGKMTDTPIRTISNIASFVSLLVLISLTYGKFSKKAV